MKIEQRVVVLVKELDCGTAATRKKTIIIRLTKTVKDSVEQVFFFYLSSVVMSNQILRWRRPQSLIPPDSLFFRTILRFMSI